MTNPSHITNTGFTTPGTLRRSHLLYTAVILIRAAAATIPPTHTRLGGTKMPLDHKARSVPVIGRGMFTTHKTRAGHFPPFIFLHARFPAFSCSIRSPALELLLVCFLLFHLYILRSSTSRGAIPLCFSKFLRSEVRIISRVAISHLPLLSDSHCVVDLFRSLDSANIYSRDISLIPSAVRYFGYLLVLVTFFYTTIG